MSKTYFSWNVNGIRAALKKGLAEWLERAAPDVLCLQEIKAQEDQIDYKFPGYHRFCHSAEKKGYSGTLLLSKEEPVEVSYGLGDELNDREGRVITAQYPSCFLVNVYTPNSQRGLARLEYRTADWDRIFLRYLKQLEKTKPVIACGDFNVAHKEIDLANPKTNTRNPGFTVEERTSFDKYIQNGFIDTFREFNTQGGNYTWWTYRGGARARNVGWRIDYFLISHSLRPRLQDARIHSDIMGSDHCPISISLKYAPGEIPASLKKEGRMPQKEHSAHKTGNNLLSHNIEVALPLAIEGLTAVVGMGTGVSPHPWSPEWVLTYFTGYCPYVIEPGFRARK